MEKGGCIAWQPRSTTTSRTHRPSICIEHISIWQLIEMHKIHYGKSTCIYSLGDRLGIRGYYGVIKYLTYGKNVIPNR
jgi:hypothetical protein